MNKLLPRVCALLLVALITALAACTPTAAPLPSVTILATPRPSDTPMPPTPSPAPVKVSFVDGSLDLFFVNPDRSAEVWLNDGADIFRDSGQRSGSSGISVSLGDLDGGGDLDAFVANGGESGTPDVIWLNETLPVQ